LEIVLPGEEQARVFEAELPKELLKVLEEVRIDNRGSEK
jgi:hypothetical protein